jgi:hypothetical protein
MRIEQLVLFALVYKMDSDDELWSWEANGGKNFFPFSEFMAKNQQRCGEKF